MAQKIASLYADIGAKTDGFEKGAKKVKESLMDVKRNVYSISPGLETVGDKLRDFASANVTAFAVAGAAAFAFAKAVNFSITQAAEAEKVNAQLEAVITSTGGAAGMTADEVNRMASAYQSQTTYGDEAIKSAAALLMTFTKIGREVFPEAQRAVLDMSAALGQDLKSSSIQLGKALNDPINGITALSRVGVSFTAEQKEMIANFVKMGDTVSAQRVILDELSREFGGSASAAADTYDGQIKQLKNSISDLGEEIGNDLLPELRELVSVAKVSVNWTVENYEAIKKYGNGVLWVINPLMQLSKVLGKNLRGAVLDTGEEFKEYGRLLDDEVILATKKYTSAVIDVEAEIKAMTDANKEFLSTLGSVASAEERYNDTNAKLTSKRMELEAEKQKLLAQGYREEHQKIQDINLALEENAQAVISNAEEHELANRRIILGLLERKLMQDGVLDDAELQWLLEKGQAWGIYSQTVIDETRKAIDEANLLAETINMLPTEKEIFIRLQTTGNLGAVGDLIPAGARAGGGDVRAGTAYMVGERGREMFIPNADGKIVPNQNLGGGNGGMVVNINLDSATPDPERVARQLAPAVKRVLRMEGIR